MNYLVLKDKKRRQLVKKYELKRLILKIILKNRSLPKNCQFGAQQQLTRLPRNSSKSRLRNRCIITGRPRGVYNKYKLSRLVIRELASLGELPGLKKMSW